MLSSLILRQPAVRTTSLLLRQVAAWQPRSSSVSARPTSILFSTKASASSKKTTPPSPPPSSSSNAATTATTPAQQLAELTKTLPHMDVVRYTHKNRTWTFQHVHYYSEALAIGLMENGFQVGDVVLSYLPTHLSEQMVLQFACAKAGLILYTLDPALAITNKDVAQKALTAALQLSKANILISQEAGDDVDYISLVQSVVPELRIYDTTSGLPFVTPRFPHLRMCLHTGFDQDDKYGWFPLRQMVVPSDNLDRYVSSSAITPATPLAGSFQLNDQGIPTAIGTTLTNVQVLQGGSSSVWPTMTAILQKQFHTIEGVGVIF